MDQEKGKPDLQGRVCGFIGLGHMGKPMARHLLQAGAQLSVHNRSQGAVDELVAGGAKRAATPRELAEQVGGGIIFLMTTNTAAVEAALEGEEGLLAGLAEGSLVVDHGSDRVDATRRWQEAARERGSDWLDAPVSGGEVGAEAATLTLFVGGEEAAFQRALPFFRAMSQQATLLGPSGAGQLGKLCNQILVAQGISAVSEAMILAKRSGLDLGALRSALMGGFAQSRILDLHGQRMIEQSFEPGGEAVNQLKDVDEGLRVAEELGLDLPMLKRNQDLWQRMLEAGMGGVDHSGLFRWYEEELNK